MRNRSTRLMAVVILLVGPASASHADPVRVDGTLRVAVGSLGGPQITGSGIGSSAGGVGSDFTVPQGLFRSTEPISVAISGAPLGLSLLTVPASPNDPFQNEAGDFGTGTDFPLDGNLGGTMGNNGLARLYFLGGTSAGTVPLDYIGGGGSGNVAIAGLPVTVIGAIWSNLGVDAVSPTRATVIQGAPAGIPVTVTASAWDRRTPGGLGSVQLIAPASARLSGGILGTLPVVGVLTLEFVPQPTAPLLGGAALSTVLVLARIRRRRT